MAHTSGSREELLAVEKELRQSVLQYLSDHPQAMDTLDGIAEWWVQGQGHVDLNQLERVLHRLTEEGRLQEVHSGSLVRFSLRTSPAVRAKEKKPCQD